MAMSDRAWGKAGCDCKCAVWKVEGLVFDNTGQYPLALIIVVFRPKVTVADTRHSKIFHRSPSSPQQNENISSPPSIIRLVISLSMFTPVHIQDAHYVYVIVPVRIYSANLFQSHTHFQMIMIYTR